MYWENTHLKKQFLHVRNNTIIQPGWSTLGFRTDSLRSHFRDRLHIFRSIAFTTRVFLRTHFKTHLYRSVYNQNYTVIFVPIKNTVFILFPAYIFGAVWSIKKQSFKRALAFIRTIFASGILNTNTVSAISSSEYHCLHFANLIVLINLYTKEILPVRKIPLKSIAHFPELVSHSFPLSIIELKITALPLTYKHTVFILSCVAFNITWYN